MDEVRQKIDILQKSIAANPFYDVPSVRKKKDKGGYYLHATDDIPEIRKEFFDCINTINCTLEAVMGRKHIDRFVTRHKEKQEYFYADLLSHSRINFGNMIKWCCIFQKGAKVPSIQI